MGIAWLLLRSTFAIRPKRTLLFLFGYALSAAVMITLLSVGQAVLTQAQDKDLLGGGDLILVPQGIDVESMKVGGISSLYYSIPQARFIVRQILNSSRFQQDIRQVSPYQFAKLLYGCPQLPCADPVPLLATGSLPDQESIVKGAALPWKNSPADEAWIHPNPDDFYHEIDHFHLPSRVNADLSRWAEWHYFNFEAGTFYGYLSIMAAGDLLKGDGHWILSLQMNDGAYNHYSATSPADKSQLPLEKVDYHIENSSVSFVGNHYEIELQFRDGQKEIHGNLDFYPEPRLYFPPTYLARSDNFESGYVIPALRGKYEGSLIIGGHEYNFHDATGYHDHNWGLWQKTQWNWGHAFQASPEYTLFFGEIYVGGKGKGLFVGVFDRSGFLTVFRPDRIEFSDFQRRPEGIEVPMQLHMAQRKNFAAIDMKGKARSLIASPIGEGLYFIQYKMDYDITLEIDGKTVHFPATGNAETFVR